MRGRIDGLLCIEIGLNLAGGNYDLIFSAELRDEQALQCFQQHPLHAAHRERCKDLVTARLCGDVRVLSLIHICHFLDGIQVKGVALGITAAALDMHHGSGLGVLCNGGIAVSYTHLDVYKRQS